MGSLAISLSAYSCTHMHHRSSPPVVDAHRIPSVLAMRPSAYLDYKPLILPFLFLPPFSSQSRRFISTLIQCVDASRCILESVRLFLPPSSCFSRNYSRRIVRHLSFVFDDYRLVFPLSFNYSLETERTNYNASQLNAPSSKKGALACLFISRII